MGRVQIDIYKNDWQYMIASLSDIACIKALITHRIDIDKFFSITPNYNGNEAGDVYKFLVEFSCLVWDLDILIEQLSQEDCNFVKEIMCNGWVEDIPEQEIYNTFKLSAKELDTKLNKICFKVKNLNDYTWENTVILNTFKDTRAYKQCKKCGINKPLDEKYFYKNNTSKDGFRALCKVCM